MKNLTLLYFTLLQKKKDSITATSNTFFQIARKVIYLDEQNPHYLRHHTTTVTQDIYEGCPYKTELTTKCSRTISYFLIRPVATQKLLGTLRASQGK